MQLLSASLGRIETRAPAHQPSGDHRDEQDACFFGGNTYLLFSDRHTKQERESELLPGLYNEV